MHLLRIVLEPVSDGMLSVSSLAGNAIAKADEPDRLRELLAAVGCVNIDAENWNRHGFRAESEHLYEIRPSFPRLTLSMLVGGISPRGVHGVSYQIDLSVADPFPLRLGHVRRSRGETQLMTSERLRLGSERYSSTGNIGENFQRLLGAPSLDPLQTVLREAVQNIADAALPGTGPEIEIRLRRLTRDQHNVLASRVLSELPQEQRSRDLLASMLSTEGLAVMEICDFGTVGLGGPTRSDRIPAGETQTDFIDFLRNIGTPRDTEQGGGTYGFGKVALYRASKCSTILVDTLPHSVGPRGRRLIGCHIGRSFETPENGMHSRFTGRHWWGVAHPEDGIVDPITGRAAKDLASEIGLPERDTTRSGTSIMILDFDTAGEELDLVGSRVIEGLLWNFWPRMMRDAPAEQRFTCRVVVEGSQATIPCPEDFPPLDLFSKAMRAVRCGTGNNVRVIASQRPAKELGTLATERGLRAPRLPLVADGSLFPTATHHIALMRPIELVVKYLEGTPLPDERLEWAGVFVASREDEVERAFAESEPPAHDDWIPNNFPRSNAKRYVTIALKRLKGIASEMGLTRTGQPASSGAGSPLARVAGRLGAVLEGVTGDGANRKRRTNGGRRKRPARAKATPPSFERLELSEDGRVAIFSTEVSQDPLRSGISLSATAAVAIEGGSAASIETGIQQPIVLSIRSLEKGLSASGDNLELTGHEGKFEIRILVPDDCAVTVAVRVYSQGQS